VKRECGSNGGDGDRSSKRVDQGDATRGIPKRSGERLKIVSVALSARVKEKGEDSVVPFWTPLKIEGRKEGDQSRRRTEEGERGSFGASNAIRQTEG